MNLAFVIIITPCDLSLLRLAGAHGLSGPRHRVDIKLWFAIGSPDIWLSDWPDLSLSQWSLTYAQSETALPSDAVNRSHLEWWLDSGIIECLIVHMARKLFDVPLDLGLCKF